MPVTKPFALDQWVAEYRRSCKTFLHDSCVDPLTINELRQLGAHARPDKEGLGDPVDDDIPQSYGTIRGSERLRALIASTIGPSVDSEDVLVTSGAISANFLVLDTLCGPGDHVICQYPTYGQLFEVPRRAGADVSFWRMSQQYSQWTLEADDLRSLVRSNTKMIVVNNPANPTGTVLSQDLLKKIVEIARANNILILSDEVFRPLFHGFVQPPSLLDFDYEKTIITGSMSKAYALPGIRLGWVVAHPALRETALRNIVHARDYTTIAVSQVDDQIARYALQPELRKKILQRSAHICARNIAILEEWVAVNADSVKWCRPEGAGTCIVSILDGRGRPVDDAVFAERLAREEEVLAPPASVTFDTEGECDLRGGLRVGIVMKEDALRRGLDGVQRLLARFETLGPEADGRRE